MVTLENHRTKSKAKTNSSGSQRPYSSSASGLRGDTFDTCCTPLRCTTAARGETACQASSETKGLKAAEESTEHPNRTRRAGEQRGRMLTSTLSAGTGLSPAIPYGSQELSRNES